MKDSFKNSMKNYLESHELSDQQFDDLSKLLNEDGIRKPHRHIWTISVAASLFVIALAMGMLINGGFFKQTESALLIAEEVAKNHLKMKPLEVTGNNLNDIKPYFSALEFSLSSSNYIENNNLKLLGGRYCSIQGISAAQLRMKQDGSENVQIVYQAPYDKELFKDLPNMQEGQDPVRHYVNGIAVDVWIENGILFARSFSP